ncbi:MAG: RDD family protein [archaeon]
MTEKVFWKSALKASALMYFVIGMITTLILILFFNDRLENMVMSMINNKEAFEATFFPMAILHILLIFSWIAFAFIYKKLPTQKTIWKVFLFNLILTGIELTLINVFQIKEVDALSEIFVGLDDCCLMYIPVILLTTIMFAYFFDFFKKREEKETSGETKNKLASIPRRLLAYIIDSIILLIIAAIISFVISSVATSIVFNSNIELSYVGVITLMSFCTVITQMIYWTVLEGKFGASIGKKILKMKVVKENGQEIDYIDAFFRNITKFADNLLFFLPIDILTVFATKNKQRFFDKVAGTIVVRTDLKEKKEETK